jgi:hypothetical protein
MTQTTNVGALPEELKLRIRVSYRAYVSVCATRIRPSADSVSALAHQPPEGTQAGYLRFMHWRTAYEQTVNAV